MFNYFNYAFLETFATDPMEMGVSLDFYGQKQILPFFFFFFTVLTYHKHIIIEVCILSIRFGLDVALGKIDGNDRVI